MRFELHPQLAADTLQVASLDLSELRLMNDARFPWCILVPRVPDIAEWHHLPQHQQSILMSEISAVSNVIEALPGITKLNVGALGNRVPQLHIHVLGRHPDDAAWPDPVWGFGTPERYDADAAYGFAAQLRAALKRQAPAD
jgi:diadenosine tetraphosphate (Ap4A) HIT family hydrolase